MEEPQITTLAVRPGVVDTEMQNDIRTKRTSPTSISGRRLMVDGEAMGPNHEKFVGLKREGKLLSPDSVGSAIAGMAIVKDDKIKEYSGKFVNWDDHGIAASIKNIPKK